MRKDLHVTQAFFVSHNELSYLRPPKWQFKERLIKGGLKAIYNSHLNTFNDYYIHIYSIQMVVKDRINRFKLFLQQ